MGGRSNALSFLISFRWFKFLKSVDTQDYVLCPLIRRETVWSLHSACWIALRLISELPRRKNHLCVNVQLGPKVLGQLCTFIILPTWHHCADNSWHNCMTECFWPLISSFQCQQTCLCECTNSVKLILYAFLNKYIFLIFGNIHFGMWFIIIIILM